MRRSNEAWLRDLSAEGPEQADALRELRETLLRGLHRGLSFRRDVDDEFLEDVLQDSLLRVLERLGQFEGRSRFTTWATAISIRIAISGLRRRHWRDVSLDDVLAGRVPTERSDQPAGLATDRNASSAPLERQALLEAMYRIIEHDLTDRQRQALLAELKGMPQDRIAELLGSNRNAIYKLTHDARRRLRRGLEAAGFEADDIHASFSS